jgi:hypothetical protein
MKVLFLSGKCIECNTGKIMIDLFMQKPLIIAGVVGTGDKLIAGVTDSMESRDQA